MDFADSDWNYQYCYFLARVVCSQSMLLGVGNALLWWNQDVEERLPSELSGGMKKRVALARAIISDDKPGQTEQEVLRSLILLSIIFYKSCDRMQYASKLIFRPGNVWNVTSSPSLCCSFIYGIKYKVAGVIWCGIYSWGGCCCSWLCMMSQQQGWTQLPLQLLRIWYVQFI